MSIIFLNLFDKQQGHIVMIFVYKTNQYFLLNKSKKNTKNDNNNNVIFVIKK